MADYAIGLSFHKAHRTIVRAVDLTAPCRYFATRDASGFITLPTLDTGASYVELQGITQSSFQITDNDQEFRLLGDDGWADSVITGARVQSSNTAYFLKDTETPAGAACPQFRGNYDEGFRLIERSRYNKDQEIYVEFLKELGQASGTTGNYIYDFTGYNAVVMNYNESRDASGLTEITFDLMSRGRPIFGRYDAGAAPITFGGVQSSLLFLVNGTRQAASIPVDNGTAIVVTANLTATYTTNGTIAMTQLALGDAAGSGFRLEVASTGALVPAVVSLATNVVTIDPVSSLAAGTIYRLRVVDGAITQAVDGTGSPSPTGVRRPIQGFSRTFRTA
jgi:hypothetical protein